MFTAEEATDERKASYVAALEHEIEGYETRSARIKAGKKDPLMGIGGMEKAEAVGELADRVKQCKAEIARVKKVKAVEPAEEEAAEVAA